MRCSTGLAVFIILIFSACTAKKEIPVQEGYLQINGSEVYYKTMGEGDPIMIVHGGPVLDHSYFLPHLEKLAQKYKLVFYDQRAAGRSSIQIDSTTMSLDGFVEDIELLRNALSLKKINLLGHSWGGLLAMKYAIKYNENLDHLILSNPMAPSVEDWQAANVELSMEMNPSDRKRLDAIMSSGLLRTDDPTPYLKEMMRISYKAQFYDTTKLEKLSLYMPKDFMFRNQIYGLLAPQMNNYNLYGVLSNVEVPTLVIFGESESAAEMYGGKMVSALKNAELKIIPQTGHFPFVESTEKFIQELGTFLTNE